MSIKELVRQIAAGKVSQQEIDEMPGVSAVERIVLKRLIGQGMMLADKNEVDCG